MLFIILNSGSQNVSKKTRDSAEAEFHTAWMPFLLPNQQCPNTEGRQ